MPIDPNKFDRDYILSNKRSKKSAPRTFEDEERDRRIWTAATILLIVFFVISFATGYDYVRLKVRALENQSDPSLSTYFKQVPDRILGRTGPSATDAKMMAALGMFPIDQVGWTYRSGTQEDLERLTDGRIPLYPDAQAASKMKLASILFDRQVYVVQNGPMEFVVELGFLAPMKAGIGALAGIEEMTADAFSAAGEFAQFAREMQPDKKPRGHVVRVHGMRYELNDKISDDTVLSHETGSGYDFRYAITSKHSRRQMIVCFERIDIWKTNEFLAVQREFEKGVEY